MPNETDPLNPNGSGADGAKTRAASLHRRRRKGPQISPLLIGILSTFCIAAISIGVLVVFNAERRRRAPKQLWINLQQENATAAEPGCETTIMLYRHCEKYGPLVHTNHDDQHCSYLGLERAHFIPTLFGVNGTKKWPVPSFLYALSPDRGDHSNFRQVETLRPLATIQSLDIHQKYKEGQETALAQELFTKMQSGDMCGKATLVSWTHRSLPQLAEALGCGRFNPEHGGCPSYYPEASFDQVWMLKFVYEPASVILTKKQKKRHPPSHMWAVYPTITEMNFDPLAFSHVAGDYPEGGKAMGGAWSKEL